MIRGMKKKLLIGLLTAAVVGSSLAPSVPYSVEFTQEAQAAVAYKYTAETVTAVETAWEWNTTSGTTYYKDASGTAIGDTLDVAPKSASETKTVYTKDADSFTAVASPEVESLGSYYERSGSAGSYTYTLTEDQAVDNSETYYTKDAATYSAVNLTAKASGWGWPDTVIGKFISDSSSSTGYKEIASVSDITTAAEKGAKTTVYTQEEDTSKASVSVEKSKDTKSTVAVDKIGSKSGDSAIIDKNKATEVTVDVVPSEAAKTIKSVVAKVINTTTNQQIGSDITATKVDGTDNTYKFAFQTTEDEVKILVESVEEDLMITPKLTDTLASNVGTAALTSTSAVKYGKTVELKVTLAEGAKASDVSVKANDKVVTGTEEDGVITYNVPTKGMTADELEIFVSGHRDNDGLDTEVSKNGSKAKVDNTSAKDVSVDANSVLEAVKEGETKYVNALIKVSAYNSVDTAALKKEVDARTTVDTKLKLAGCIDINIYKEVSDTADGAATATTASTAVTSLQKPVVVNYFLPSEALNKSGYKVLRYHDTIDTLTTTPNADGEYIEVSGGKLTLHVKKLSEFAVMYNDEAGTTPEVNPTDPTDPTNPTDPTTPDAGNTDNGAVTPANPAATAGATTAKADEAKKAPAAPAPAKKLSAKTGSPKTADYAVNSLLALLTGAAGLFGISLMNSKKRKDEDQ